MRKFVARLVPSAGIVRKLLLVGCVAGIAAGAFFWGWQTAQSQTRGPKTEIVIDTFTKTSGTGDYNRRVVAYIYGNVPVTREDLGEYLIARQGAERVEALVNRRILELVCQKNGIYVTDAEVKAQLNEELKSLGTGITEKEFANQILKRFNKTLFEWKEDVIRPRLALEKIVKPTINVTPVDLQQAFEARYGPKVKCRMVVFEENDKRWTTVYESVKNSEAEFASLAKNQFIPALAAQGGEVPPIHKHFGDKRVEDEAFSLKDGEVSRVIEMPDKTRILLKRDGFIPEDTSVRFENERLKLHKEIAQFKLNQEVPKFFQKLRQQAAPSIILTNQIRQEDLERKVQQELTSRGTEVKGPAAVPSLPSLLPVDTSKLQGPPPGIVSDIKDLPTRPISEPGTVPLPTAPPSGTVIPTSQVTPATKSILNPSPTVLPAIPPVGGR